jgi:hypothetical protein
VKAKVTIGGALVIAGLAGMPFLLPATFHVEKTTILPVRPAVVFSHLNNLSAWEKWSAWNQHTDPTLSNFYQGPVSGVGSELAWKSKNSGDGRIVITAKEDNKQLDFTFFPDGKNVEAQGKFLLEPIEKGTRLTWISRGDFPGYLDRVNGLILKRKIETDLEKGLQGLKGLFEPEPDKKLSLGK